MTLDKILSSAVEQGASDIHLKHGIVPVIRKHGLLRPISKNAKRLTEEEIQKMASTIMTPEQQKSFKAQEEIDMGYGVAGLGRFRVNIFWQRGATRIVIRSIPSVVPNFENLNLPPIIDKIASLERGLILVTGVAGSGKSTTMAAMVDRINRKKTKHIVTIEDPIEYLIRDRKSIISQRELGADTKSYAVALRAALRQDPDVILIGEMRDKETIETALLAAETGHLVISTLHTLDAPETISRIISVFDPHQHIQMRTQLATILRAVISQRLARTSDKQGVLPVVEVMISTARIRKMIVDPAKTHDIRKAIEDGHNDTGMQSFDQSLMAMLTDKKVTFDEALKLSSHPENFALRCKGVQSMDGKKWHGYDKSNEDHADWGAVTNLEVEPHTTYKNDDDKDDD